MKEPYLLAFVGLFIVALVFRLIHGLRLGKRLGTEASTLPTCGDVDLSELVATVTNDNGKASDVIRTISRRAATLPSPELRAAYKCAAGNLALSELKRPNLAVGLYLRALRESPNCLEALVKLQDILTAQKRFRRLEWTYWDVLGRLEEGEAGSDIWINCWSGLASVYSLSPRKVRRADAIRKAIAAYVLDMDDAEDGLEDPPLRVLETNE